MDNKSLFGHFIKVIVMCLGLYLIAINIIVWANGYDTMSNVDNTIFNFNFNGWHRTGMAEYRGFKWFYERLSTYPGLNATVTTLNNMANVVNTFGNVQLTSGSGAIEYLRAIFMLLTCPLAIGITLLIDIVRDLIWFFGFLWNIGSV